MAQLAGVAQLALADEAVVGAAAVETSVLHADAEGEGLLEDVEQWEGGSDLERSEFAEGEGGAP